MTTVPDRVVEWGKEVHETLNPRGLKGHIRELARGREELDCRAYADYLEDNGNEFAWVWRVRALWQREIGQRVWRLHNWPMGDTTVRLVDPDTLLPGIGRLKKGLAVQIYRSRDLNSMDRTVGINVWLTRPPPYEYQVIGGKSSYLLHRRKLPEPDYLPGRIGQILRNQLFRLATHGMRP